jgi:LPXTG-motif cell wall-anchored protein
MDRETGRGKQMNQPTRRRHALVGLASMVAGAVILVAAPLGNAGATPQQATPSTSEVADNPTCGDLAPEGVTWTELKVDPVKDGTFTDGTLEVTIEVTETDDGDPLVFNWTSNIGVDAVFVKGGPGGLLYVYDPESTGDTGLHAPVNPNNDKFFGLSHVSFCYDKDQATTTTSTTSTSTSSTTSTSTTSTTMGGSTTSTTPGESTTTTAMGDVTTTTVAPSDELPRTGSTAGPMLGIGAALLAGGAALVGYARRFRAA